jgi:SAM-dependent methyltransferase
MMESIDTTKYEYQFGFSAMHAGAYDTTGRLQKANKALAVLRDYFGDLGTLSALDIGCSTGIMSNYYAPHFKLLTGVDIDEPAVEFARKNTSSTNTKFIVGDAMNTGLPENSFDVVFCAQIYEHVPDAYKLMAEINRVLKPGGVCYFAAGNRIVLIESHYKLPLLSVVPKWMAHLYLKMLGRGNFYYETHYTYWTLKKLVSHFDVLDYTKRVIAEPEKFCATEMISPGSFTQKIYLFALTIAYWISPSYIWLLKKR